jgi:hypothetical protein
MVLTREDDRRRCPDWVPASASGSVTPQQSVIVAMTFFWQGKGPDDTLTPRFAWTPSAPCDGPLFRPADRVDRRRITPRVAHEEELRVRLHADLALDLTYRASRLGADACPNFPSNRCLEGAAAPPGVD